MRIDRDMINNIEIQISCLREVLLDFKDLPTINRHRICDNILDYEIVYKELTGDYFYGTKERVLKKSDYHYLIKE